MSNVLLKVVIIGGSGFIGTKLTEALLARDYEVVIIDLVAPRIQHQHLSFLNINIAEHALDPKLIDNCFGIINLAGVTIGKRWNKAYQKIIYESRILTTQSLVKAISMTIQKPKVLVNASAAGYYGDQKEKVLTEESVPGKDFLAHVCIDWEAQALQVKDYGVRVVLIRTANVLGPGGLLSSLSPLFKKGLGGYFGSGLQFMPWIHWKDIVDIYIFALEKNIAGPYNVGAGKTISQKILFKRFAQAINAPIVWPIPYIAARIALGKFADALIDSQNTSSQKIITAGYEYHFDTVEKALEDIYPKK